MTDTTLACRAALERWLDGHIAGVRGEAMLVLTLDAEDALAAFRRAIEEQ